MLVGAAWGVLAYAFYDWVIVPLPLPFAVLLAPTILFPGLLDHIIIANTFRFRMVPGPHFIYTYVPNPYTETLGAMISMLIGLAVVYILWRTYKMKT